MLEVERKKDHHHDDFPQESNLPAVKLPGNLPDKVARARMASMSHFLCIRGWP